MTEDLGTTPRKPLTPTQRLALYERFKGICVLCTRKIAAGDSWIDEHMRALGLAGSNDPDNRAPVHKACAATKTHDEDMPRINKAKAQKKAVLGIRPPGAKIQNAGFTKYARAPRVTTKSDQLRAMREREFQEANNG